MVKQEDSPAGWLNNAIVLLFGESMPQEVSAKSIIQNDLNEVSTSWRRIQKKKHFDIKPWTTHEIPFYEQADPCWENR